MKIRVLTLGNHWHPLARAGRAVIEKLEGFEIVGHLDTADERASARDPTSAAYLELIRHHRPDLLVSLAYGRILPAAVLAVPAIGSVNVHPSLLPEYRGANPVMWALYEGRSVIGVTVHAMAPAVDTGDVLAQRRVAVAPEDTAASIYPRIATAGAEALGVALRETRRTGAVHGQPQPGGGFYRGAAWREYDRLVPDWGLPARELVRRCNVFAGWTNLPAGGRRIFIAEFAEAGPTTAEPGTIIARRLRAWEVAAGDGRAVRLDLQRPGRSWVKALLALGPIGVAGGEGSAVAADR